MVARLFGLEFSSALPNGLSALHFLSVLNDGGVKIARQAWLNRTVPLCPARLNNTRQTFTHFISSLTQDRATEKPGDYSFAGCLVTFRGLAVHITYGPYSVGSYPVEFADVTGEVQIPYAWVLIPSAGYRTSL